MNILDVVNNDLCTGCGVCVSEGKGKLQMEWDDRGFLIPKLNAGQWEDTSDSLKVCPFNPIPAQEVADEDKLAELFLGEAKHKDDKIGHYEKNYIGFSREFRESSSSGGIATFLFRELLKRKIVDHLFIVKEVNGTYEYGLFSTLEDITKISKTRYIPVTLEQLFGTIDQLEGKVAVSGVACFIKAIRLKQHYNTTYREKIPFLIGIICGGWKSRFFTDYLSQRAGIEGSYRNQEYRIKDEKSLSSDYSFGAFDASNDFKQMKMSVVGDMWGTGLFKSNACDFCTDVTTELADISLGDAWLPEYRSDGLGNSIIITRTKLADLLINEGINSKLLSVSTVDKGKILQSQRSSFLHRQDAVSFRLRINKMFGRKNPYIRPRMINSISLPYMMVQWQRMRVRKKSLDYWKADPRMKEFLSKMAKDSKILIFLTKVYHRLRG